MSPVDMTILTGVASAGCGFVGKIFFDWVKLRGEPDLDARIGGRRSYDPSGTGRRCGDHENCVDTINSLEKAQSVHAAVYSEKIIAIEKRLSNGDELMKNLAVDVSDIKINVATLVAKAK